VRRSQPPNDRAHDVPIVPVIERNIQLAYSSMSALAVLTCALPTAPSLAAWKSPMICGSASRKMRVVRSPLFASPVGVLVGPPPPKKKEDRCT